MIPRRQIHWLSFAVALAYLTTVQCSARAQVSNWTFPSSGSGNFQDPANWSEGVPGTNGLAQFIQNLTTTVNFTGPVTNRGLAVATGNVTFAIGDGQTYTVTGMNSFQVGGQINGNPATANLTITSGTLAPSAFNSNPFGSGVGVSGGTGTITVNGANAAFKPTGRVDFGIFGNGTLNVISGSAELPGTPVFGALGAGQFGPTASTGTLAVGGSSGPGHATVSVPDGMTIGFGGVGNLQVGLTGTLSTGSDVNLAALSSATGDALIAGTWNHSNGTIYVGGQANAIGGTGSLNIDTGGVVTVTGSGSGVIDYGSTLIFGTLTTPSLNVNGSVSVKSTGTLNTGPDVNIGSGFTGLPGTVIVNGTWNHSGGAINIGGSGSGTVTVGPGGSFTASGTGAGSGVLINSLGTLTINGGTVTTSNLTNNGTLNLQGGTLTIDAGELFTSTALEYNGTLNLRNGATAQLPAGAGLAFGTNGQQGTLNVTSGAQATISGAVTIASGGNGVAFATIGGGNSTAATSLTSAVSIDVGSNGAMAGNLTLNNHATVSAPIVDAGNGAGSGGSIVVAAGGAILCDNAFLATGANASAVAYVAGTWTATNQFEVGGKGGALGASAVLTITPGGVVNAGNYLSVYQPGTVNLNGGTISMGTFYPYGGVFNFNSGIVAFTGDWTADYPQVSGLLPSGILTGGKAISVAGTASLQMPITLNGGSFSTGILENAGALTLNTGTFSLTNSSLTIGSTGQLGQFLTVGPGLNVRVTGAGKSLTVGPDGVLSLTGGSAAGTSIFNNGEVDFGSPVAALGLAGQPLANAGRMQGTGRVNANLSNNANGVISADAGQRLVFAGASNFNNANGAISLTGGTVEFTGSLTNAPGGFISGRGVFRGSSLNSSGTGLTNSGVVAFSGGTSDVYGKVNNVGGSSGGQIIIGGDGLLTFHDDVVHNGQEIRTVSGSRIVFLGGQSGSGPFTGAGDVENDGDLRPGNSPGIANYGGGLILGHSAMLHLDIGGTTPGTGYDQLNVAGRLQLDGTLEVDPYGGFMPSPGDMFTVMTFGSVQGMFSGYAGLNSFPGFEIVPTFGSHSLMLTAVPVPEPGSFLLLACPAGIAWARYWRRRWAVADTTDLG
jgi:T5SS/PEP-CTERM-associated repeat protein